MIMILAKGKNIEVSEHLTTKELDCKCKYDHCRSTLVSVAMLERFEELRTALGNAPLTVTSSYRCSQHNYDEGGKALSRHQLGEAIDILCPEGMKFEDFEKRCKAIFPFCLPYKYLNFCHCDVSRR